MDNGGSGVIGTIVGVVGYIVIYYILKGMGFSGLIANLICLVIIIVAVFVGIWLYGIYLHRHPTEEMEELMEQIKQKALEESQKEEKDKTETEQK